VLNIRIIIYSKELTTERLTCSNKTVDQVTLQRIQFFSNYIQAH